MNSKIFFLLLTFFSFTGCGVKSRPAVPPDKAISSYIESFTGAPHESPPVEEAKKN